MRRDRTGEPIDEDDDSTTSNGTTARSSTAAGTATTHVDVSADEARARIRELLAERRNTPTDDDEQNGHA